MDTSSLLIGLTIGIVGAFATGFLKKAGEDLYLWLKGVVNPNSVAESKAQVVFHLHDARNEKPDHLNVIEIEKISQLTFDEIEKAIDSAPPLQREQAAKSYIGLRVEWDTYLRAAHKREDGNISLRLSLDAEFMGRSTSCEVPEDEYRELGVLPEGAKIRVVGEISEACSYDIKLSNARLEILSTQPVS